MPQLHWPAVGPFYFLVQQLLALALQGPRVEQRTQQRRLVHLEQGLVLALVCDWGLHTRHAPGAALHKGRRDLQGTLIV